MNPTRWLVSGLMMFALAACGGPSASSGVEELEPVPDSFDEQFYSGTSSLQSARIDGRLGRFSANTEAHGYASLWDQGLYADIRGHGEGVVMAALDLSNIELREAKEGDVFTGGWSEDMDWTAYENGEPYVSMVTCAGAVEDEWEEDVTAEKVEVEVAAVTNEAITLQFAGELPFTNNVVTGEIKIELPR